MKHKIINIALAIAIICIVIVAIVTNDQKETTDAFTGATPTNEVIDTITAASEDGDDD